MQRATAARTCATIFVVFAVTVMLAGVAGAQVNGAIYTTNSDGSTVNANIYASKDLVYLSGGPENMKDPGLVPDGLYYFQVTDPSGMTLLSADDVTCRQVVVLNGRVDGVPSGSAPSTCTTPGAYHAVGTQDDANGALPVQLIPYNDTPNNGGEYKAWMTPVTDYVGPTGSCPTGANHFGFCDSNSKTDNFKVKKPNVGYITVCKFNDVSGNGIQDPGEPPLAHWPITATGVDGDTGNGVLQFTDDLTGCTSFSFSGFTAGLTLQTVTLTEGTQGPDWTQTAPANGTCSLTGNNSTTPGSSDTCNVSGGSSITLPSSGGVITVQISAGDDVIAPSFGNTNLFCTSDSCAGGLEAVKDANTSYKYTWGINKSVSQTSITTSQTSTTVNYTVTVTNNGPSGWLATGTIKVANTSSSDITGVNITDSVDNNGGSPLACTITDTLGGVNETIPAGSHINVPYTCTYTAAPSPTIGTNTANALSTGFSATATHSVDFTAATVTDKSVTVTDSLLNETLGTVSIDPSTQALTTTPTGTGVTSSGPGVFNYSYTVQGTPGTCVTVNNTATFTTSDSNTTGSSGASVKDCVGADLTVSKTATPTFTRTYSWTIAKTNNQPNPVEQESGSVNVKYTVTTGFTTKDSGWAVSGIITVTNPNNWEAITATVTDSLDNGSNCTYTPSSSVTVAASSSSAVGYSCTLGSGASGTNYAAASWNSSTSFTPDSSATSAGVGFAFTTPTTTVGPTTVTVTDSFHGGAAVTLGTDNALTNTTTINASSGLTSLSSPSFGVFTYTRSITVVSGCVTYNNTATIVQTSQTAGSSVEICGPANTGALTMGFWQNKNGQGIIAKSCGGTSGTSLYTFLTSYDPFKDLTSTTCSGEATYVYNVIKAATCGGSTCNAMLKAQMLATALDVYFSDAIGLGGNKIGAPAAIANAGGIGTVSIDLTNICNMIDGSGGTASCSGSFSNVASLFGVTKCATVSTMLSYQNIADPVADGGKVWYSNNKSNQTSAKNAFDAINNSVAFGCP